MEIFQRAREQYGILGICSSNQTFNKRIVLCCILIGCCSIVSLIVDIAYVANSFMQYLDCICTLSATIIIIIGYVSMVFRRTTLFDGIDKIEKLIDTSEIHDLKLFKGQQATTIHGGDRFYKKKFFQIVIALERLDRFGYRWTDLIDEF